MDLPQTERLNPKAAALDTMADVEALGVLLDGQAAAVAAVRPALGAIAEGARVMAETVAAGSHLVYAGAGSSALMAVADGLELHGTFGIGAERVRLLMAGGLPSDSRMPGASEDDEAEAAEAARRIEAGDAVIAVAASGRTPYTVALARRARARGARTICIANVRGAPLLDHADVAICLETPPEMVAGSTRMGAGTAQKVTLNMMSTLMGLRLGHIHAGLMVNLVADNDKLQGRAARIVNAVTGCGETAARRCLGAAGGEVKPAVLLAAGAASADAARAALERTGGRLRAALEELDDPA